MADTPIVYQRLPGRGAGLASRSKLWRASDHLLLVKSSTIEERYRRFFFADIQAIIIQRTARRLAITTVLLLLAALSYGGFNVLDDTLLTSRISAGIWVVVALIYAAFGPTCAAFIQTATGTERVPSITRVHTAERILQRIRPDILAAQNAAAAPTETAAFR